MNVASPGCIFLLGLVICAHKLLAGGGAFRSDLSSLKPLVCSKTPLRFENTWKNGVFDVEMIAFLFTPRTPEAVIEQKRAELERSRGHRGYWRGVCASGARALISVPASSTPGNTLALSKQMGCARFSRLTVPLRTGHGGSQLARRNRVTSTTCKSPNGSKHPQKLLFIIPDSVDATLAYLKGSAFFQATTMHDWVNKARKAYELPPLKREVFLDNLVSELLQGTTGIYHDASKYPKLVVQAKARHHRLIGEDQVLGASLREKVQLLWLSASHRNLILDPEATHLGISSLGAHTGLLFSHFKGDKREAFLDTASLSRSD